MDEELKDELLSYLEENSLDTHIKEAAFEQNIYNTVAGTDEFEIIPIPYVDGSTLNSEEKKSVAAYAKQYDKKLLYRVSMGDTAIIFGIDCDTIAIQSEIHINGFPC